MFRRMLSGSLAFAALTLSACQEAGPVAPATALSISAAVHPVQLPYKARFTGTTTFSGSAACPAYLARMQGTGVATHLGFSTVEFTVCGMPVGGGNHVFTPGPTMGVATAANGDELWFTDHHGTLTAGTNEIRVHSTIVGGTGRFANATGEMDNVGYGVGGWTVEGSGWIRY